MSQCLPSSSFEPNLSLLCKVILGDFNSQKKLWHLQYAYSDDSLVSYWKWEDVLCLCATLAKMSFSTFGISRGRLRNKQESIAQS